MAERPQFRLHASVVVTNPAGELLVVQEAKPQSLGLWNLPGGHVDHGEGILAAAVREMREETGLSLPVDSLLGIYSSEQAARFVFRASLGNARFEAGDEISDARLMSTAEILSMADAQLLAPKMFRQIIGDLLSGKRYPLDVIQGPFPRTAQVAGSMFSTSS